MSPINSPGLFLINQQTSKLAKSVSAWTNLYFSDRENRRQTLQEAIDKNFFALLHDPKVQETLTFKDIAELKVGSRDLLSYTLQQSQCVLRCAYLIRAEGKTRSLEQCLQEKILELKGKNFKVLNQPLQNYEVLDETCAEQRQQDFKKLLTVFKGIAERDLKDYIETLKEDTQNYLKIYLDVFFLDTEDWRKKYGDFTKLMFIPMPDCIVCLGKGEFGLHVAGRGQIYITNLFSLIVSLGNFGLLVAHSEQIKVVIATAVALNVEKDAELKSKKQYLYLQAIMADAVKAGDIAQIQFLLELGMPLAQGAYDRNYTIPLHQALQCCHYGVAQLLIAHGVKENLAATNHGHTPLQIASEQYNIVGILLLYAAGADFDQGSSSRTVLDMIANDAGSRIKGIKGASVMDKLKYALVNPELLNQELCSNLAAKLEVIRILLICGANKTKMISKYGPPLIEAIYEIDRNLTTSFLAPVKSNPEEKKKTLNNSQQGTGIPTRTSPSK